MVTKILVFIIFKLVFIQSSHAEIIESINFDNEPTGIYTFGQVQAAWNNPTWSNGVNEGRCFIIEGENAFSGKSLRVLYPMGGVGPGQGGAQWQIRFDESHDSLYVSYMVMVPEDFGMVRGGKLPGLAGGTAPTGGQIPDGTDGFSARIMWRDRPAASGRTEAVLTQYVYYMEMTGSWGTDFFWAHPNPTWSSTRRFLQPGVWHNLKTRIIMNTPGVADGRITSWLDGELALDTTVMLRAVGGNFGVDMFFFSTFYGGGDASWAPQKDEYIYFDNFIFSTTDIFDEPTTAVSRQTENFATTALNVFPNPANPFVSISIEGIMTGSNSVLTIYNIKGEVVEEFSVDGNFGTLQVGHGYTSGIYFAVLKNSDRAIISQKKFSLLK